MPHHQSFGAGQHSSREPSGQSPATLKNLPGLNVPRTDPTPNRLPSQTSAGKTSPSSPKPLFGNVPGQGTPRAGTDTGSSLTFGGNAGFSGSSFFGHHPPNVPMFLPPGLYSRTIPPPPAPLQSGIKQQVCEFPLQSAVSGAVNLVAGNKTEDAKYSTSPSVGPFKTRPMPKGRLHNSGRKIIWPSARQADGAVYWRVGESISWPHAWQMNGKPFWH